MTKKTTTKKAPAKKAATKKAATKKAAPKKAPPTADLTDRMIKACLDAGLGHLDRAKVKPLVDVLSE